MDRRLLDWFRRRTTPYTGDVSEAQAQAARDGGGDPPDDDGSENSGPVDPSDPIDIPDQDGPDGGGPFDPSTPVVPDDPPGQPFDPTTPIDLDNPDSPFDPSGPVDPHGLVVVVQQAGFAPGVQFGREYDQEAAGSTPSSFTDPFSNGLVDRWWRPVRGSALEANDLMSVGVVESSGTPLFVALFVARSYTDKLFEVTLDGVAGTQYILGRIDPATGNGYAVKLINSGAVGNTRIMKLTGWAEAQLGANVATTAFAAGDRLGILLAGTNISAMKNGVLIAGSTRVDASYASGYGGIGAQATSIAWRDFRVS